MNKTISQSVVAAPAHLNEIFAYIKEYWHVFTRSNKDLAAAAHDSKMETETGISIVYISQKENRAKIDKNLREVLNADDFNKIELRVLPADVSKIVEHGLLYLPNPYVVPGGRFNEMYGWDSYFILVGLVRDGELELARNITENFFYEIEHYGTILNANRTYYLSRSQPPFLSQMVLEIYRRTNDKIWLRRAVSFVEKTHQFWTTEPHLIKETNLSRFWDFSDSPAPEVLSDEKDAEGKTHYDRIREFYRQNEISDYDVSEYYDRQRDELTANFYRGDRTMRESGFDPSNRFGQFNIDIVKYNPVCLNSLIFQMEKDLAEIFNELGEDAQEKHWRNVADKRAADINNLLWDEKDGLYYDYNFTKKTLRPYPFVTTFYPLWTGIATKAQAARIIENLNLFEKAGGLQTSTNRSGCQWDAPFGWSPMQMIAVEGLRRYGFETEASRIAVNFLSLVFKEFLQSKTIVEKYDVVRRESEVGGDIQFGYDYNVIGFGWTNGAFVRLFDQLPTAEKSKILNLNGIENF